eukprot:GHVU01143777.1.p1 GENE.GHVU01143777.1~~GHVU01143777.1.p1  ORF type:complete len:121 (+),score=4.36 GHVU01143777.1:110-472(+)
MVSLRRCHNTPGLLSIDIMIVSPKDPTTNACIRFQTTPYADLVHAVKDLLDRHHELRGDWIFKNSYKPGQDLEDSDLILYVRTDDGVRKTWSKLSKSMPATDYRLSRTHILTGSEGKWPG